MTLNHTLVIPTFNRPELLERLVHYYTQRATSMRLLVLDSSKPEIAETNSKSMAAYGDAVQHVTFPDTTQVGVKLFQGLGLVKTRYASFCADDDLVFLAGLDEAIRFLETSADYACAHGLYINFRLGDEYRNHMQDVYIWREYGGPSNDAHHPGARIFRLFQNYESLFYAVFRTADLRDIFKSVQAIPSLHYQELFQSVASLIKGKVWRFPRVYAARQSCDPAEPSRDKWQTYYWFADNAQEFLEQYRTYAAIVWQFYEEHGPAPRLARTDFIRALDLAHSVYFSKGCPAGYFHSVLEKHWESDKFFDVGQVDLFSSIGSKNVRPMSFAHLPKWAPARVAASLHYRVLRLLRKPLSEWHPWRTLSSGLNVATLNHRVARSSRVPWRCRLAWPLRWVAGVADFRDSFIELSQYLDGPSPRHARSQTGDRTPSS